MSEVTDEQRDAIAANAIAAALVARWGCVPLSLRYDIAWRAIAQARPDERLAAVLAAEQEAE